MGIPNAKDTLEIVKPLSAILFFIAAVLHSIKGNILATIAFLALGFIMQNLAENE